MLFARYRHTAAALLFLCCWGLQPQTAFTQDSRPGSGVTGTVAAASPQGTIWADQWEALRQVFAEAGYDFDYLISNELGGEEAIVSGLRRRRIELGGVSMAAAAQVAPAVSVLLAPYLFDGPAELDYVYERHALPVLEEIFADKRLVLLGWGEVGQSHLYAQEPLLLPRAAQGKRLRGPANRPHQAFLEAIGADAAAVGIADLVSALQTGMIDGGMANPMFHYALTKDHAPHYTLTKHIHDTSVVLANKRWFDGLPKAAQAHLRDVFADTAEAREAVRDAQTEFLGLLAEAGISIHRPDSEQLARWRLATEPVQTLLANALGPDANRLLIAVRRGKAAFAEDSEGGAVPEPEDDG